MDILDKIYEKMFCELGDIANKDKLDSKDVDLVDKFVDIIKDIDEISMSQDPEDMKHSKYGQMGRSYDTRDGNKEHLMSELNRVMSMATDDRDRKAISRLIEQMGNA